MTTALAARRPAGPERGRLGQAEHRRPHPDRAEPPDPLDQPGQAVPGAARHRAEGDLDRRRLPRLPVDLRHRRGVHRVRRGLGRPVRGDQGPPARAARHLRHPQRPLGRGHPRGRSPTARSGSDTTPGTPTPTAPSRTTSTPTRRSSSPARSRCSGGGRATTASGTRCTTSRCATCATSCATSTPTTTAGPRGSATSSAPGWARRSWTTPSTSSAASTTWPTWRRSKHDGATYAWAMNLARHAAAALRRHLVVPGGHAVRRLADRAGQRPVLPEALDRPDAHGGRAARQRPDGPRPGPVRPRQHGAGRAGERLLQRHAPVQPGPVPHRLRRRPDGRGREGHLRPDDLDPVDR